MSNVFTPQQVTSLNNYQASGEFHPFTCGNRHAPEHDGQEGLLVATVRGWMCPYCDYTQDWAHGWMQEWKPNETQRQGG